MEYVQQLPVPVPSDDQILSPELLNLLRLLEFSFSPLIVREMSVARMLRASYVNMQHDMKQLIITLFDNETNTWDTVQKLRPTMQSSLNLEVIPFATAMRSNWPVREAAQDDERRLVFQAMLLYVLRQYIPLKYSNTAQFLQAYPAMDRNYPISEVNNLMKTANWFDLLFFTVVPGDNRSWAMNLIIRLCEGRELCGNYVTGRNESEATSNRVLIFNHEGGIHSDGGRRNRRHVANPGVGVKTQNAGQSTSCSVDPLNSSSIDATRTGNNNSSGTIVRATIGTSAMSNPNQSLNTEVLFVSNSSKRIRVAGSGSGTSTGVIASASGGDDETPSSAVVSDTDDV